MHALSFQFKRAHLCVTAFGRRMFRGTKRPEEPDFDGVLDMTPARFDILYLIFEPTRPRELRPMDRREFQMMSTIRKDLGLSRATISVAIRRLVELGFVTLHRFNGRSKLVKLTELGRARILRAISLVFTGRELSRHFRRYFASEVGRRAKHLFERIDEAIDLRWYQVLCIAKHFGNRATILYRPPRGGRSFDSI